MSVITNCGTIFCTKISTIKIKMYGIIYGIPLYLRWPPRHEMVAMKILTMSTCWHTCIQAHHKLTWSYVLHGMPFHDIPMMVHVAIYAIDFVLYDGFFVLFPKCRGVQYKIHHSSLLFSLYSNYCDGQKCRLYWTPVHFGKNTENSLYWASARVQRQHLLVFCYRSPIHALIWDYSFVAGGHDFRFGSLQRRYSTFIMNKLVK